MTGQDVPVDDFDLEALDEFLGSDRTPPKCMMLSDLDGFLTGVAIGPELIRPSEWLRLVWGGPAPDFADEAEATAVLGAIFSRYNEILGQIQKGKFEPIFWLSKENNPIAADWAEGFLLAMELRYREWRKMLKSKRGRQLLFPILAQCGASDGASLLGIPPEVEDEVMANAADDIPASVLAIAAYWKKIEAAQATEPKARRSTKRRTHKNEG